MHGERAQWSQAFLQKPYDLAELKRAVAAALGAESAAAPLPGS